MMRILSYSYCLSNGLAAILEKQFCLHSIKVLVCISLEPSFYKLKGVITGPLSSYQFHFNILSSQKLSFSRIIFTKGWADRMAQLSPVKQLGSPPLEETIVQSMGLSQGRDVIVICKFVDLIS